MEGGVGSNGKRSQREEEEVGEDGQTQRWRRG